MGDRTTNITHYSHRLAKYFGKQFGVFVASGTLALEVALRAYGIGEGDEVIVPDNCCYLVPLSVIRIKATPVFVATGKTLLLQANSLLQAISKRTKAVIAVHNYGLPCDIDLIRKTIGNSIILIEDAAQTWKLEYRGFKVGTHSDVVVTSLGKSKPLALGGGGVVFSNNMELYSFIDCYSRNVREGVFQPLPYALNSNVILSDLNDAIKIADYKRAKRNRFVEKVVNRLENLGHITWKPKQGDKPSWNRLPVYTNNTNVDYSSISCVQKPHSIPTYKLLMFKGCSRVSSHSLSLLNNLLLIKTNETKADCF